MTHYDYIEHGGFAFTLILNEFKSAIVTITDESDLDNPAYLKALKEIHANLRYYTAVGVAEEYGFDPQWTVENYKDAALLVIQAYEQNIIDVSEKAYQRAIASRDWKPSPAKIPRPRNGVTPGYAYLMVDQNGLYKIGHSKDPSTRVKSVTSSTNRVTLVCQIETKDMRGLEWDLHKQFDAKWDHGEWFTLSPDDVEYIKSLAVQA